MARVAEYLQTLPLEKCRRVCTYFGTLQSLCRVLDRRLAALDTQPDPDGRFCVNEFCCRDNSWQATVVRLIDGADAVLMDLRGFDARRAGCELELGELARRRRPEHVVLLTDASTDRDRLGRLVGTMAARPQVLHVSGNLAAQSRAAVVALLRAAR